MLETSRLLLRPFVADDAAAAFGWFGDPAVMRFIAGGPHTSIQQTRKRLAEYQDQQARLGFSRWMVFEKHSGRAIGDSGLVVLSDMGSAPDLGFRFAQAAWGRGYATEVATAWITAAFETFGLPAVSAFAHVQHQRSRRVLEKVGFRFQARQLVMGLDSATYSLTASDYASTQSIT
jgi:[ribosomal protein S5]-alanine N-acetyltransferase